MFHKNLFNCISNASASENSFIEPASFNITITLKSDESCGAEQTKVFSFNKLKKKFNSSNEKLSHRFKSKLKRASKSSRKTLEDKEKKRGNSSMQCKQNETIKFDSNILSSTVISKNRASLYSMANNSTILASVYNSFNGFYSENSDVSDDEDDCDSDNSFCDDFDYTRKQFEETLKYNMDIDSANSSLSSIESLELSYSDSCESIESNNDLTSSKFNPLVSSSRYETSSVNLSCIDCKKQQRRSLGSFLPAQTSSRIVLTESPQVSRIQHDSAYFSNENSANNVFSSTLI